MAYEAQILSRQGEVGRVAARRGRIRNESCSLTAPSVSFAATPPSQGRIGL